MVKATENNKIPASTLNPSSPIKSQCKKKFKGVRMRSWGSWVSEIRAPNQKTRIWLGSYSTPEAAARAYDAALICLKGLSAATNLNFRLTSKPSHEVQINPDNNTVLSPKSIQRVAAAAAANATFLESSKSAALSPQSPFSASSYASLSSNDSNLSPTFSSLSPNSSVQIEDDLISLAATAPLASAADDYMVQPFDESSISAMASWYNFDSPKYNDTLNGVFSDPSMAEDTYYEDGDIRLWTFC